MAFVVDLFHAMTGRVRAWKSGTHPARSRSSLVDQVRKGRMRSSFTQFTHGPTANGSNSPHIKRAKVQTLVFDNKPTWRHNYFILQLNNMHAVPAINHPCTLCCRPTSLWCSRCQSAWYCSPEHISSDWPRHRRECVPAGHDQGSYNVNMIATPPPAEPQLVTVSAILFSPEDERPRITTINCKPSPKASQGMCPTPILDAFFDDQPVQSIVLTQGLNGEPLRFPLHLWYAPNLLNKGSPVNRAIFHITSGAADKPWAGPVVVLKHNGSRRQGYSDAGSNDLPALSAYFLSYK